MNNSQLKFIDQIRNNKKIAFLSFLVFLAAIVIIVAGVRLLVGDKNEKLGERELKLVDSLQESFGAFPREIILLEGGAVQSRAVLNNIKQTIENDWAKLKKVSYLSSESVAEVDQVITSLQSYLNSQMIGQPVVERPLPVAREAFILTQGIRNEIVAYANKPRTNIELPVIIGAVSVLIISMFLIAALFWVDFVRRFKFTQEEKESDQAAILRLLDELVDLADGDLTISATVSEDFTGAIADSINFTIDQLRQLVSRINSTAVQVSQAAQSTQQTALHLAEASDHQAQEIAGASAAINEMAVTIDQVSANASESALVAGKSVSIANNGAKLVQNTIHGMDTIREQIQDTSKRIKRLGESSQEIGDIVSLINDIADQTNILALNAAIQASMAGDAGRGFAVVADEVQRLAERSAAATKQIESLVKTIQSDTNEAVISMEQTTSEVVRGARLAQDAGVALEEIEGVSANLAELIQNISNAARQQASSAGHISNTMNVIQEITSQTSAGTGATAKSIGDLANMALDLRESVAGFTLPSEMIADLEHEQKQVRTKTATAMPPTLKNSIRSSGKTTTSMEDLLEELELNEEDMAQSGDFFELLAGDDEDDLLSEFDVDLSDIEFPDNDKKSVG